MDELLPSELLPPLFSEEGADDEESPPKREGWEVAGGVDACAGGGDMGFEAEAAFLGADFFAAAFLGAAFFGAAFLATFFAAFFGAFFAAFFAAFLADFLAAFFAAFFGAFLAAFFAFFAIAYNGFKVKSEFGLVNFLPMIGCLCNKFKELFDSSK